MDRLELFWDWVPLAYFNIMRIPTLPNCHNVLIVSPVSSGKSWLMQKWINSVERSVTIDVTAETMDDSFTHIWHSPKQLGERLLENPYYYRLAYHPSSRKFFDDFKWCVDLIWQCQFPRWLFVDEIHEVCSTGNITEEMDRVIRYARHIKLGFCGATQKFSDVPTLLRDNTRMFVIFHNTDEIELKSIRGKFGKIGEETVRNLRPLIYEEDTGIVHQEPQCLVWTRSRGLEVYDLGDKIKDSSDVDTQNKLQEPQECLENSQVQPKEEAVQSLEPLSGIKENQLQDGLPVTGIPQ